MQCPTEVPKLQSIAEIRNQRDRALEELRLLKLQGEEAMPHGPNEHSQPVPKRLAFFALSAQQLAEAMGLPLDVQITELHYDFSRQKMLVKLEGPGLPEDCAHHNGASLVEVVPTYRLQRVLAFETFSSPMAASLSNEFALSVVESRPQGYQSEAHLGRR